MYFNSEEHLTAEEFADGKGRVRKLSRVAECGLLHDFDDRSSEIGFFLSGHETATRNPKT